MCINDKEVFIILVIFAKKGNYRNNFSVTVCIEKRIYYLTKV